MLLSQERVLALLYDKTFPAKQDEDKKEPEEKKGEIDEGLMKEEGLEPDTEQP